MENYGKYTVFGNEQTEDKNCTDSDSGNCGLCFFKFYGSIFREQNTGNCLLYGLSVTVDIFAGEFWRIKPGCRKNDGEYSGIYAPSVTCVSAGSVTGSKAAYSGGLL